MEGIADIALFSNELQITDAKTVDLDLPVSVRFDITSATWPVDVTHYGIWQDAQLAERLPLPATETFHRPGGQYTLSVSFSPPSA